MYKIRLRIQSGVNQVNKTNLTHKQDSPQGDIQHA